MGTYDELIAHTMSVPEICAQIGADSLVYLSLEGMMRAIGRTDGYCNACFTGSYPVDVCPGGTKAGFEGAITDVPVVKR
jgi:amidophosphoribosyltransferase